MSTNIELSHPRIIGFYEKYSSLQCEQVNLMFIDLLENLLNNAQGKIDNSTIVNMLEKIQETNASNQQIMTNLQNMKDIQQLSKEKHDSDINNIHQLLNHISWSTEKNQTSLKQDLITQISLHLQNEDMSAESIRKMDTIFQSQFTQYLDKTKLFYMEQLPSMLEMSNKPLLQTLHATEERINGSLSEVKEKSILQHENTVEMKQSLHDHILQSKTSSKKGDMSEHKLLPILTQLFPVEEILHTGGGKQAHCCDYTIVRKTAKNILIENKDYNVNIGPDNIKKFIDDIERNNCHGIFLSQQTGISGKPNYKIDIHKNNVLVYLHDVNYDPHKIRAAVDIIDQMHERLSEIDMDENTISKDDLDTINVEFNNFVGEKENLVRIVNDFQKRMTTSIKQLNLSCLEKYLNNKFAHMKVFDFQCDICGKGWDTRRALAAHRKGCLKNHQSTEMMTVKTQNPDESYKTIIESSLHT